MERIRRVLIASPDESGRAAIRTAARAAGFRICGYAKTAEDAVARAKRSQPDICLLDLDLPGGGLQAAGEIVAELPTAAVVVLADFRNTSTEWCTSQRPTNGLVAA
jgi:two-component system, NarL family, nitrate/nitrite response regulator NarL